MRTSLCLLLLAPSLVACGSMKKDMQTMCDAPSQVKDLEKYDPADRMTILAGWVGEHLQTAKGKSVFESLVKVPPKDRASVMRNAAKEEGVEPCAFADVYDAATKAADAKPAAPEPAAPKPAE